VVSRPAIVHVRALACLTCASLVVALGLLFVCGAGVARAAAPSIDSAAAPSVAGPSSEQVAIQVNPGGLDTSVVWDYGLTTDYGSVAPVTPVDAGSGSVDTTASDTITGLTPGTLYHVQAVASNSAYNGIGGPDQTFTAGAPDVTTGAASAVSGSNSSEMIAGTVNPGGTATTYYFEYGPANGLQGALQLASAPSLHFDDTTEFQTPTLSAGSAVGDQGESATLTGLAPGIYDYTLVAMNTDGTVYGATNSFTIGLAQATTGSASQIDSGSESVNGIVNPTGVETTYHFEYGPTTAYGNASTETDAGSGNNDVAVQATLTGLTSGQTYHYRIVATTAAGSTDGQDATFTLSQSFANTLPPTSVTTTSATLNGIVGAGGLPTSYYFQWGLGTNGSTPLYGNTTSQQAAIATSVPQDVSASISGLIAGPGDTYHYRLVVVNAGGTFYGQDQTVTPGLPQFVSYGSPTPEAGDTTETVDSQINPGGLATTVEYEYDTTSHANSGTYAYTQAAPGGSGNASVDQSQLLTGLTPGTLYYYRVVATNNAGAAVGPEQTFTVANTPTVSIGSTTGLVATAAVLNGTVNANGYPGGYYFEYATDAYYSANGSTYNQQTQSIAYTGSSSPQAVASQLYALTPSTTYDYELVADNGVDPVVVSANQQFTTAATSVVPTISSPSATTITDNTATLQASLNPEGQDTQYYFEYGTSGCGGGTTTATVDAGAGSLAKTVSVPVTQLTPDTTYTFCVVASNATNVNNATGPTVSAPQTFTTLTPPTGLTADPATAVHITTATLNASVNAHGFPIQVSFQYGTTTQYGFTTTAQSGGSANGVVSVTPVPIANLVSGTTYHYRLVATNGVDTVLGPDGTFTTLAAPQPPSFSDLGPSGLDDYDATINASINAQGQATTWSVAYGTTNAYGTTVSAGSAGNASAAAPFSLALGGLTADTTYHYQIIATNNTGTTVGPDRTFTTLTPPTVSTAAASAPGATTVVLNGSVNPNGFATTYSFQYGLTSSYGSTTSSASAGSGQALASASLSVGGLSASTTYHFRAVATNGPDVTYGADQTFTTVAPPPPSASTETSSAISQVGVTLKAQVDPLGLDTTYVFQYGPTAAYGSSTVVADLGGGLLAQPAVAVIIGLTPGTTYHFRVVATNASGVTFGSDETFQTVAATPSAPGGGGGSSSGSGSSPSGGATGGGAPAAPTLTKVSAPVERGQTGHFSLDTGVRVACPAGGPSCSVSVPLSYTVTQVVPAKKHKKATTKKVVKTLASVSLSLAAGQKVEAAVPLSTKVLALVAAAKRLKATARVSAWATGGGGATLPIAVTLTVPKPSKKPASTKKKPKR